MFLDWEIALGHAQHANTARYFTVNGLVWYQIPKSLVK